MWKLPKCIYENLPFAYFIISGILLVNQFNWLMSFSAVIFYCTGCMVLVARSSFRRLDRYSASNYTIPEVIYEYLPYAYAAIAIFILMETSGDIFRLLSFSLLALSLRNLMCRHNNRKKADVLYR